VSSGPVNFIGSRFGRPTSACRVDVDLHKVEGLNPEQRWVELAPSHDLSLDDVRDMAKGVLLENEGRANNPYARKSMETVMKELGQGYLFRVFEAVPAKPGEPPGRRLVGGGRLSVYDGPTGDGRLYGAGLGLDTMYLSHEFNIKGAGAFQQVHQSGLTAAGSHLMARNVVLISRWSRPQRLNREMGMQPVMSEITDVAPQLLFNVDAVTYATLPQDFRGKVDLARHLQATDKGSAGTDFLKKWLDSIQPRGMDDTARRAYLESLAGDLPDGLVKMTYMEKALDKGTISRKLYAGAQWLMENARDAVFSNDIEHGPIRQTLVSVPQHTLTGVLKGFVGVGVPVLATELAFGHYDKVENDNDALRWFNGPGGARSVSYRGRWSGIQASLWYTGPQVREPYLFGQYAALPYGRLGPPPGDLLGKKSASAVAPMRANLAEVTAAIKWGTSEHFLSATAGARFANALLNLSTYAPLESGAPGWFMSLLALSPVQPTLILGGYWGDYGVMMRDTQVVTAGAAWMTDVSYSVLKKAKWVVGGGSYIGVKDGPMNSPSTVMTINPAKGHEDPFLDRKRFPRVSGPGVS